MICTRSLWVQCDYLIIWVLLGVIDQLLKRCQVHIVRCRNLRSSLASERSANPFQRSCHCGVPPVFTFMDFLSILPDFSLGCSGISSSALSSPCPHFSLGPALSISHRLCLCCVPYRTRAPPPFPSVVFVSCSHSAGSRKTQLRTGRELRTAGDEVQAVRAKKQWPLGESHLMVHTNVCLCPVILNQYLPHPQGTHWDSNWQKVQRYRNSSYSRVSITVCEYF